MGACCSSLERGPGPVEPEDKTGVKLSKLASLKLGDAERIAEASSRGHNNSDLAKIKAAVHKAKVVIDAFGEQAAPSPSALDPAKDAIFEAKELLSKLTQSDEGVAEVAASLSAAETALEGALQAAERNEASLAAVDAANSAAAGARRLEKVTSGKGNSATLTKVTSKVAEAEAALGLVAMEETYGEGAGTEELSAASEKVQSAVEGLEGELKTAPAEVAAELEAVKEEMKKAAKSLEKRVSFK